MALSSLLMFQLSILAFVYTSSALFLAVEPRSLSIVTDKEALISFKSHVNTEPPNVVSTWDQTSSPCNWTGVFCNKFGERVVGLNLSGAGIKGSISPQLGNLSFLRSLELQNNQLTGTIPHQLGNLFRLRVLNMSFNSLEGAIPPNTSGWAELRILDLMQNNISGRIPEELSHLTNLQVLNLAQNNLSGNIPPSISNLSSLTNLSLGTNSLGGMMPADLSRLRNLKQLDLKINNLTGTVPPSIYNMSSLVYLALASNDLSGRIPSNVGVTLPNLLVFNFCLNKFTGTIPGSLHNLTKIQIIRTAYNLLHGPVPPGLGNLPELQVYHIGFNKIVSSGANGLDFLTLLTNSTQLNLLAIGGNLLEGIIPESVGNLSKVLSKLYMGGNSIYGSIPASIGRLSGLALLNLSYNSISGEIPREIGQLEELVTLDLAGNNISGMIPTSMSNLEKLIKIDLSGNEIGGSIPTSFRNFQDLLSLDLSSNKLNGTIPREILLSLPSLSIQLNLSKNLLTGPLPPEVGLLDSVVAIDVSENSLSGTIPNSIGNCKSLEQLFMANNMFSGSIPDTLGDVKALETLDISSNKLSGSIPPKLQSLEVLQLLNLSFNDLKGEVPTAGVFTNLSRVHLEGNPKLRFHLARNKSRGRRTREILVLVLIIIAPILALCFAICLLFSPRKNKEKTLAASESFERRLQLVSYERRPQLVSYDDLRLATGNFNRENLIGKGRFGSVYKGKLREFGVPIAVKVLDTERTGSSKSFLAECEALRNVRHRNLVKLVTSCSSMDLRNMEFLALVYECISNGNLGDWIHGKRRHDNGCGLTLVERLNVSIDVGCAMSYLHHESGSDHQVVHRDLKPSNILLDEEMTAKVGDFGLAKLVINDTCSDRDQPSISSTHVLKGSIGYIPPEYGLGEKPSAAGDVYSYGIVLLELFTGKSPTDVSSTGGLGLRKWVQMAFARNVEQVFDPDLLAPDVNDIAEAQRNCLAAVIGVALSCAAYSPDRRITMTAAVYRLKSIKNTLLTS